MPESVTLALSPDPMRDMIERVERDQRRVVLTRDGAPVAAIVPIEDLEALKEFDAIEDEYWSRVAAEEVAKWEAEGRPPGIPMADIIRELGIDLTDQT